MEGSQGRGFNWSKRWNGGMCVRFVLLASGTAFDVFVDIGSETRPPKLGSNWLMGFEVSGVSGSFVVMASLEDSMAGGVVIRDIDLAFIGEDSGFVLPVGEARTEGKGDGTVYRLEGLEYEGVVSRGRLDTVREGGVNDADKDGW